MRLYDLKVNHLRNPLGYRMTRCVFSWKVAEAEGKRQEAARVVVASDEKLEKILYDSGYDSGANSLAYRAEVDLRPRARYYWTVTVRTDAGEEAIGEVEWFETGKWRSLCRWIRFRSSIGPLPCGRSQRSSEAG